MGYVRLHLDSVPVLPASSTGLSQRRELGGPLRVSLLARVQSSAQRGGHRVSMPLQASRPLSLSVLWHACDLPNYTMKQHTDH